MTADVELLPLPDWGGAQVIPDDLIRDYARANVEHHTEALRAEVAEWRRVAAAQAELHGEAEARAEGLDAELHDCQAALLIADARAERLAGALREAKETMLSQVKWEACDCGCPQGRKPTDAVSVTWLRAVQQVEVATARAEEWE